MRRKRSNTIEAHTIEDYVRISVEDSLKPTPRQASRLCSSFSSPLLNDVIPDSFVKTPPPSHGKETASSAEYGDSQGNYWSDIDFQVEPFSEGRSFCEDDTAICTSKSRSEDDLLNMVKEKSNSEAMSMKQIKVMVIGAKNTGRHTLIDSAFDKRKIEQFKMRNALDLMIRKQKRKEGMNVFKFWIKDANQNNFDQLIKVHYKTTKIYIFVYKTTDKTSFECLHSAIEQAKAEAENFVGILIGHIRHPQGIIASLFSSKKKKREVDFSQGEGLMKKYGLAKFFETNLSSNSLKKELLDFLTAQR